MSGECSVQWDNHKKGLHERARMAFPEPLLQTSKYVRINWIEYLITTFFQSMNFIFKTKVLESFPFFWTEPTHQHHLHSTSRYKEL